MRYTVIKKILLPVIGLCICLCNTVYAQEFQWAKKMGGSDWDHGHCVSVSPDGSVYTAGMFNAIADFDPGSGLVLLTASGGVDVFISKLDARGNYIWAKRVGGTAAEGVADMVTDKDGNVYFVGSFAGTADFDPGPAVYNLTGRNTPGGQPYTYNAYLCKLDSAGNFVWAKHIAEGAGGSANGVALDRQGNIYVGGEFRYTGDFDPGTGTFMITSGAGGGTDGYIVKLDPQGQFIWARNFATQAASANNLRNIVVDDQGSVFATGSFSSTIDFDPGPGVYFLTPTTGGTSNTFVVKLDAGGNFSWARYVRAMQNGRGNEGYDLALDPQGDLYVMGNFYEGGNFDPPPGNSLILNSFSRDNYLMKLSNAGSLIYATYFLGHNTAGPMVSNNNFFSGIVSDLLGNIYFTGSYMDTVDFDPGPGVYKRVPALSNTCSFLMKLDHTGSFTWMKELNSLTSGTWGNVIGTSVFVDTLMNIYTTGYFTGSADFDPDDTAEYRLASIGSSNTSDIFVLKLSQVCTDTFYTPLTVCDSFTADTAVYYTSGVYTHTFPGRYGCDSVVVFDVYIGNNADTLVHTACTRFVVDGQVYTESGNYRQVLKNSFGCDSILTLYLTIIPPVHSSITGFYCQDSSYDFNGRKLNAPGIYRDTLTRRDGCDSIVTLTLQELPAPQLSFSGDILGSFCIGDSLHLAVEGGDVYRWYELPARELGAGSSLSLRLLQHPYPGIQVAGYSEEGCGSFIEFHPVTEHCCDLLIPTAFTPNGDGLNDGFGPAHTGRYAAYFSSKGYLLEVFNRWGERVFVANDMTRKWDGVHKGAPADVGVYYYHLRAECLEGTVIDRQGDVTLIR